MSAARRPAIGFDFGTSTTLIASARKLVPLGLGEVRQWMPSLVGYDNDGAVQVAEKAETLDDEQRVRSIKRAITENRETVEVSVSPEPVSADDLIVELLREAARRASRQGQDLSGGTPLRLGCPAMWDGHQRRRLLRAAQRANVPVLLASMVDEPVAAGIAWLTQQSIAAQGSMRVVVFDMGGGTLDIAVLDARDKEVSVLAALGSADAGDALDETMAVDLEAELGVQGIHLGELAASSDGAIDEKRTRSARRWLRDQARIAKEALSREHEHVILLDEYFVGRSGEIWYSRDRLNAAFHPQMERAEEAVDLALRIARIARSGDPDEVAQLPTHTLVKDIDVVLLSGGMCRIPYINERLRLIFGSDTTIEPATNPPENAVVVGLAKAANYEKINVFRPAFDILLEWDGGREYRTIYDAFTPIAGNAKIAGHGDKLRYTRRASSLSLPPEGNGQIRVLSHSGEPVRATLGGRAMDGYPVSFTDAAFTFSIFPDGRVRLLDRSGVVDGLIEWHRVETAPPHRSNDDPSSESTFPSSSPSWDEDRIARKHARRRPDGVDAMDWLDENDDRGEFDDLVANFVSIEEVDAVSFDLLQDQLLEVLQTLSEREAGVVRLRFGLVDGKPRTLDEIAHIYGVTRERIRQIESKALQKLRHPSRSQALRDYLD